MRQSSGNFRKRSDSGRRDSSFNREGHTRNSDSDKRKSHHSGRPESGGDSRGSGKSRFTSRGSSSRGGNRHDEQVEWKPRLKSSSQEQYITERNTRNFKADDDFDGDEMPSNDNRFADYEPSKGFDRNRKQDADQETDGPGRDKPRVVRTLNKEKRIHDENYWDNRHRDRDFMSEDREHDARSNRNDYRQSRDDDRNDRFTSRERSDRNVKSFKPYRSDRDDSYEKSTRNPGFHKKNERGFEKKERFDTRGNNFGRPYPGKGDTEYRSSREKHELFVDTEDDSNDNRKFKPKPNYQEVAPKTSSDGLIRLNKFISNSGICSRREADEIILEGKVKVNGQVITELGTKVKLTDTVTYKGKTLIPEKKVYILVNKPKDCVTTKDDPEERRTVFDLIQGSCFEQVHAVGRLDRNTTGVLLLTNDGELTQKLTHPKFNKRKIYHVWLDRNISEEDLRQLSNGVELEDGFVKPDDLSFVEPGDRKQLGIEIHSGQNRVVRRMFEHFQYKVLKLDRVYFAGLTKKSLPRGEWRYLTNEEVSILKRLSTR